MPPRGVKVEKQEELDDEALQLFFSAGREQLEFTCPCCGKKTQVAAADARVVPAVAAPAVAPAVAAPAPAAAQSTSEEQLQWFNVKALNQKSERTDSRGRVTRLVH